MQTPLLEVDSLACGYDGRAVLSDVTFHLDGGEFLCLLGPNGAGKTTLFKSLLRLISPLAGQIRLAGQDIWQWSCSDFATRVAYVPQAHTPPFAYTVGDVVIMGRAVHLGIFGTPAKRDIALAQAALDSLSIGHLSQRPYTAISGGQRQLVLIARALAQAPQVLILDEPTSNLDFGNQITVLDHVRRLADASGLAVILTTHDPNHALRYASRIATVSADGRFALGMPDTASVDRYLRQTYRVATQVVQARVHLGATIPVCVPTQHWQVSP